MVERALLERKREFERRDDLRAAWMTSKSIDIFENQSRAGQNPGNRRCNMPLRERWNGLVKDDAKALRIDLPAHDVDRVGPGVLTAHLNGRNTAVVGPKHASRRAIAEERRGDYIRLGQFIEPEGQGANFDRNEQHNAAGTRTG